MSADDITDVPPATRPADFLEERAIASTTRVAAARAVEGEASLRARAAATPPAPPLSLDGRFDLFAELKLRSPAQGVLGVRDDAVEARVAAYARGGAAAVSVLTEPDRFDGDLVHLARAAQALRPLGVPAMRKDFLVDPYQLYEARAAGAGGVLLIVALLPPPRLAVMLEVAHALGLFVLLEAFSRADVVEARAAVGAWHGPASHLLLGVNSRDLRTLEVVTSRLDELVGALPTGHPRVAESGLATPADAARLVRAGYTGALVGTALMTAPSPEALARALIDAGREAGSGRATP